MVKSTKTNTSPTIDHIFRDGDNSQLDLSANGPYGEPNSVKLFLQDANDNLVVNDTATIADANNGIVEYDLTTTDTALSGRYQAEWRADFGTVDGRELILISPSQGYQSISVSQSLGEVNAPTISTQDLIGDVDGNGYDITNLGSLETDLLQDSSSGNTYDIDTLAGTGSLSISEDGAKIVSGITDINVTDSGDATATVNDDGDGTATLNISVTGDGTSDTYAQTEAIGLAASGVDETGDGAADDFFSLTITVASGRTARLVKWGIRLTSGNTDSNVTMRFRDDSFTTVSSISATSPPNIARPASTIDLTSDGFVEIRVDNNGSTSYWDGATPAIKFDFIIEVFDT